MTGVGTTISVALSTLLLAGIVRALWRRRGSLTQAVTGADAPKTLQGLFVPDEPLLAVDRVRYWGEPIALVVAETRRAARAAALLIAAAIEDEPAVLTIEEALAPNAPAVREGRPNYLESSSITRGCGRRWRAAA